LDFITSRSRLNSSSLVYKSGFVGEVAEHVYVRQTFVSFPPNQMNSAADLMWQYGIEASNAVSNVALVGGKVVAYGHSFVEAGQLQYFEYKGFRC